MAETEKLMKTISPLEFEDENAALYRVELRSFALMHIFTFDNLVGRIVENTLPRPCTQSITAT